MATSGTLSSSKYEDRYLKFTWERTGYNASKKQSTIKWSLKGAGGSSVYYKAGNFLVEIDGDTVYSTSQDSRIELYNGTTVKTGTKTITHDSTGTKSFKVYIEAGIYTYAVNCSGSNTFTLDPFYDIKFNANGGSGVPATQTKMYDVDLTLSSTKPTRAGYTFLGWGTSSSDTSVNYSAGDKYTSDTSTTLYAIWSKKLTLSFNANGGSGTPNALSATIYNATTSYKFTIPTTKPTRVGYNFLGYSTSDSATSESYLAGETITISSNTVLYAVWERISLAITFDAESNGGLVNENSTFIKNIYYGDSIGVLPEAEKKNYKFLGWFTEPSGGTKITSNLIITSSRTFYAQFELQANCYTKQDSYIEAMMYRKINGVYKTGVVKVRKNGVYSDISM